MIVVKGQAVSTGIAIGPMRFSAEKNLEAVKYEIDFVEQELIRLHRAQEQAAGELEQIYNTALHMVGEENAAIFQMQKMMIWDLDYQDLAIDNIKNKRYNAEYAVKLTADTVINMLDSLQNTYLRERRHDVRDISRRLIRILQEDLHGIPESFRPKKQNDAGYIIGSERILPSEAMQLDTSKICAFVTNRGSPISHAAILARNLGIPAVTNLDMPLEETVNEKVCIVDGNIGAVIIEPDAVTLAKYQILLEAKNEHIKNLRNFKDLPTITKSGRSIKLYANVNSREDVQTALDNGAEGIGLLRSEFIFLQRSDYPTEEQQFIIYRQALEQMRGKKVIIRTLDIGTDKAASYLCLAKEDNPALGIRGIRFCLERPTMFKTQLRALYRASLYGDLAIMLPMISSVTELEESKELIKYVKYELDRAHIAYRPISLGIMIETPAAALISHRLAQMTDFFSIGTNDLTQYTLAMDRQNYKLSKYMDPSHEAILSLVKITADNAHEFGKKVGICGELGSDEQLLESFIDIGIDELSVSPNKILPLRGKIASMH